MTNLGPLELLIIVLAVIPLGICIWGIVDAVSRPVPAWQAAGQSKVLWVALQAAGLLVCWFGFILTVVYLTTVRPKVRAAQTF